VSVAPAWGPLLSVIGILILLSFFVSSTRSDLIEVADMLGRFNDTAGKFTWAFWLSAAFAILLAILNICIVVGVILAWRGKQERNRCGKFVSCIRSWVVIPLYIFLVIVSWIFSMVFVMGSTVAADWCYNSPDTNVLVSLQYFGVPNMFVARFYMLETCH